ncbi:MAG: putative ABC transporter permease [Bacilli bacterium]
MTYFGFNFLVYGFLGYFFEIFVRFAQGYTPKAGIATFGPFVTIYGLSIASIYFIFGYFEKKIKTKKWIKILILFLLSGTLISLFEFIGGNLIEKLYGVVYWNYDKMLFNLGHYISLETAFIWGLLPSLLYFFFKPVTDKLYELSNKKIIIILSIMMILNIIIKYLINLFF